MLLTLLKVLFFFAVVLAVALGLSYLSATSEGVRIVFNGVEYALGPIQALAALAIALLLAWVALKILGLIWAFLRFVMGDETAIDGYFARTRERKGHEALSQGWLAVASGEGRAAQDQAARAEKYLPDQPATRLLAAQAAEVAGDETRAELAYRRLLEDDQTRFVGVRGLMRQRLAAGDTHTALQLCQKAYALKPRHHEVQETLLQLQTREGDWKGARSILKAKRKQGELPADVHIRRDAVLALQEARGVLEHGNSISAREAAISAAKASPDLIPAAVLAARSYLARKDPNNAARVLEKTWSVRPHPDVAATYAEIAPQETPNQRLRRFEALMKKNPGHEETRLLRAELLLAAEDFPGARRALGDLADTHPTVRTLSLMAAIERGEGGDDAAVRAWLVRALSASRGPRWVCDKCDNVMEDWAPVCDSCGGFDTLSWREPAQKRTAAAPAAGPELLPLLIGRPQGSEAHVARSFHEADAYAEGVEDHARHTPDLAESHPRWGEPIEIADVAPGMVPRESDFVIVEPSRTITDPEPRPAGPPAREPHRQASAPDRDEASPVRDQRKPNIPAMMAGDPARPRPDDQGTPSATAAVPPPREEAAPPTPSPRPDNGRPADAGRPRGAGNGVQTATSAPAPAPQGGDRATGDAAPADTAEATAGRATPKHVMLSEKTGGPIPPDVEPSEDVDYPPSSTSRGRQTSIDAPIQPDVEPLDGDARSGR